MRSVPLHTTLTVTELLTSQVWKHLRLLDQRLFDVRMCYITDIGLNTCHRIMELSAHIL